MADFNTKTKITQSVGGFQASQFDSARVDSLLTGLRTLNAGVDATLDTSVKKFALSTQNAAAKAAQNQDLTANAAKQGMQEDNTLLNQEIYNSVLNREATKSVNALNERIESVTDEDLDDPDFANKLVQEFTSNLGTFDETNQKLKQGYLQKGLDVIGKLKPKIQERVKKKMDMSYDDNMMTYKSDRVSSFQELLTNVDSTARTYKKDIFTAQKEITESKLQQMYEKGGLDDFKKFKKSEFTVKNNAGEEVKVTGADLLVRNKLSAWETKFQSKARQEQSLNVARQQLALEEKKIRLGTVREDNLNAMDRLLASGAPASELLRVQGSIANTGPEGQSAARRYSEKIDAALLAQGVQVRNDGTPIVVTPELQAAAKAYQGRRVATSLYNTDISTAEGATKAITILANTKNENVELNPIFEKSWAPDTTILGQNGVNQSAVNTLKTVNAARQQGRALDQDSEWFKAAVLYDYYTKQGADPEKTFRMIDKRLSESRAGLDPAKADKNFTLTARATATAPIDDWFEYDQNQEADSAFFQEEFEVRKGVAGAFSNALEGGKATRKDIESTYMTVQVDGSVFGREPIRFKKGTNAEVRTADGLEVTDNVAIEDVKKYYSSKKGVVASVSNGLSSAKDFAFGPGIVKKDTVNGVKVQTDGKTRLEITYNEGNQEYTFAPDLVMLKKASAKKTSLESYEKELVNQHKRARAVANKPSVSNATHPALSIDYSQMMPSTLLDSDVGSSIAQEELRLKALKKGISTDFLADDTDED